MNVTNTRCQEIDTKISDHLAFLRICALAHTNNTIFFTTDGTNFTLDRKT